MEQYYLEDLVIKRIDDLCTKIRNLNLQGINTDLEIEELNKFLDAIIRLRENKSSRLIRNKILYT